MADLRIPRPSTPPGGALRPAAPVRPDAVRSAQAAFFQAAMGRQAAAHAPAATAAAQPAAEAPSQRLLRPGSFVDIKV